MSADWEQTLGSWTKPSGDTEQEKCENAERMIRGAIRDATRESKPLAKRTVEVFAQGSYRNNTNVRQESDVDICVRCMSAVYYDLSFAQGLTKEQAGLPDSDYTYAQFKNDVQAALETKFGRGRVGRGNKAFDIRENSYCADADVVACLEHRSYFWLDNGAFSFTSGMTFLPDNGGVIINWPNQNYNNGVTKNNATGRRFKRVVRILKRLRNEMEQQGIATAAPIPSYLIECLVWNVPNEGFRNDSYVANVRYALAHLFHATINEQSCQKWCEVNNVKYLFHISQPWTREQAHAFLSAAWNYVGFE